MKARATARLAATQPPAHIYFFVCAIFTYLGPSFAVLMFARVQVLGVLWLRVVSAAVIFAVWRRPWRALSSLDRDGRLLLFAWGMVLAAMNCCFYLAISRLPLGTVAAIEFLPVIALAALGARSARNVVALGLAVVGVYLLAGMRFTGALPGFVFAFANAALFCVYIVLADRVAKRPQPRGVDGLAAAMMIAAVAVTPIGGWPAARAFTHPIVLLAGVGVGTCSSLIPYGADQLAMARLPRATYATMAALLPAFATAIGIIVLAQIPSSIEIAGIALIIAGVALHRPSPAPACARAAPRTARPWPPRAGIAAALLAVITALALVVLAGRQTRDFREARPAGQAGTALSRMLTAGTFGLYPGQQDRGVFQAAGRMAAYGRTIVTTGTEVSDGVVRQQFFVSADGGRSWRLAPVRTMSGRSPLGLAAARVAGGPRGWAAIATGAPWSLWTSPDGRSWTLAATHGLPVQPGDSIWVLAGTAQGFLAAGQGAAGQAVIWTSPDGVTWQRRTAAPLGLTARGRALASVSWATSGQNTTVISGQFPGGQWGTWLSTDGGSAWTPVTVPVTGGAEDTISGLAAGGSGLIAVRPGRADDAIAYFSPNGRTWQYAATLGAAGGFRPGVVRGSADGFAVTGTDAAGNYVAYASTGPAASWLPTAWLGPVASYQSAPSAEAGAGGTVIVAGSTAASRVSQETVLLQATTQGAIRPVPLARIPGAVVPEVRIDSLAVAGGQQVAVGSADGYPAIWHRSAGSRWRLVSSPSLAASAGLSALTSVTHGRDGWLAVGLPGPIVLTSANGTTWQPAAGPITRDLSGVGGLSAAAGPGGYVITGQEAEPDGGCEAYVFHSANLASWTQAQDVTGTSGSSQVLAVSADGTGFVSAGSHNGQPALWTTANGTTWTTIVLPSPASATGVLQQIAVNGSRVVATGVQTSAGATSPLAAVSANGGATFTPVPFGVPGTDLAATALTADTGGFTAAIQSGTPGQQAVTAWTSAAGTSWAPSPVSQPQPGGSDQLTALAPSGGRLTAITMAATMLSQQPAVLSLPATGPGP